MRSAPAIEGDSNRLAANWACWREQLTFDPPDGKRRLHQTSDNDEIYMCRP
ncbi:MAG: hypothetical protein AAF585_11810 [Verrucomicrobiota bacterium]